MRNESDVEELEEASDSLTVRQRTSIPFREIAKVAFTKYPRRAFLGLALFIGQAFIYNGVTFNLGTLLNTFYGVASGVVPIFIAIWAVSNFAGPVTLGRLFDTIGRKPMIAGTYIGSAAVAVVLGITLASGSTNEWLFLAILVVCFFLASSGASAAYLTVSEIFPMETRALAISFFYAVGTAVGGITGPLLFGQLINSDDRGLVSLAFYIGAGVMALAGVTEIFLGVKAEKASLEDLAQPLTSEEAEEEPRDQDTGDESQGDSSDDSRRRTDERTRRMDADAQMHRLRPGPGRSMYAPWMSASTPGEGLEEILDREIETIAAAVAELGPVDTVRLQRTTGAAAWGPGRFRAALREAVREDRVVRLPGRRVGPPTD